MKFVAGASGTIGQLLCNVLNSLNEEFRAFGRSQPESYFDIGNNQWRSGNFDNYESLVQAMDGCDSVFLTCSPGKQMAEHEINVIKVAQELGVKNLVKVSVPSASRIGRTKLQRLHSLSEEFLKQSGLNWSILRPNAFMQNLHGDTQGFNINRKFCLPLEGAEYAFIDALDIDDVIAPLANLAAVIEPSAGTAAPAARVSASTVPSGSPPTANPVIVPSPFMVIGIRLFPHQYLYDSPRTT